VEIAEVGRMSEAEENREKFEEAKKVDAGAFRCPECGGMMKYTPVVGGSAAWICPDCGYMGSIA
jgi:predicted RNA-binding Zn-ribbon protein involved in translation (DUF1610 family)